MAGTYTPPTFPGMNGDEPGEKVVLRTWSLTGRGGLREIQNGE